MISSPLRCLYLHDLAVSSILAIVSSPFLGKKVEAKLEKAGATSYAAAVIWGINAFSVLGMREIKVSRNADFWPTWLGRASHHFH